MKINRRQFSASAASASAFLATPSILRAQTQVFTMPSWLPTTSVVPFDILQPWFDIVSDVTGGRVQIEFSDAPAGPPPAQYDLARSGQFDLSYALHGYSGPDAFLRSQIGQFSFIGDSYGSSIVYADIYRELLNPQEEHEGVELLGLFTHGPGVLALRGRQVRSVSDMEGLRIRNPGGYIGNLITKMGAEPISMPPGAAAGALAAGEIEGATLPFEGVEAFGLIPEVTHTLEMPGGIYNSTWFIVMNQDSWGRISDRDQRAVKQISAEVVGTLAGKAFDQVDYLSRERCIAAGITVERASDEMIADVAALGQEYEQEWIDRVTAQGYEAEYALRTLRSRTNVNQL